MPETPEEQYARIRAHADRDGRLPLPEQAMWEIFPFEPEQLRVKPLDPLMLPEPPRLGEDGVDCRRCQGPPTGLVWHNDRWSLSGGPGSMGLPVAAILEPNRHLDLADLDDEWAAELGVISARLVRAGEQLDTVARMHVNRWGDGGAHLHLWFLGRPAGLVQLRGSCLPLWLDMLPPTPDDVAQANLRRLAAALDDLGEPATTPA